MPPPPTDSVLDELESRLTPRGVFVAAVLLTLATKWPTLRQPPVWDGAMSVFPAAITLAASDFDLTSLLGMPGYVDGGPNVHALSIVTWATALAYWTFGDRPDIVLPLLHLAHFALAAWTLTSLWRLAVHLLAGTDAEPRRKIWALASVGVFGACPLFFVQAGFVYLELPILALTAAAVVAWVESRPGQAAAFATAAALVKPPGLIVAGALALATLASMDAPRRPFAKRLRALVILLVGPLAVAAMMYSLRPASTQDLWSLRGTLMFAGSIPDLMAVLVLFVVLVVSTPSWRRQVTEGALTVRARSASAAMFVAFFGFFAALIPLGTSVPILPRYYLQLIPFALLASIAFLAQRSPRVAAAFLLILACFFLVNRKGHFYPEADSLNFAITERSMAYVDLLQLQNTGLQRLLEAGEDRAVFYGLHEHYKLSYPEMGYGFRSPPNGACIYFQPPYLGGDLSYFPPSFVMLLDYPWLGGEVMLSVSHQARDDPAREVLQMPVRVGRFESRLLMVQPSGVAPAATPTGGA